MSMTSTCGKGRTQIQKWPVLLMNILREFNDDDLENVVRVYRSLYLPDEPEDDDENMDQKHTLSDRFMSTFDNDEDQLKTASRLKPILAKERLHDKDGKRVAGEIEEFIQEESDFREKFVEEVFVGRGEDWRLIYKALTGEEDIHNVAGIHIWGIGGQGKSAVAKRVCLEMIDKEWDVVKVDMREKTKITAAYKAILVESKKECPQQGDRRELQELMKALVTEKKKATLFCLDNCDDIISNDKTEFRRFLECAFEWRKTSNKVFFLLTSRHRLEKPSLKDAFQLKNTNKFTRGPKNSLRELAEYQLFSLPESEAVQLFKTYAEKDDIDDALVLEIVSTCGCLPFAITMAAKLVQGGQFTPERLLAHLALDKKNVSAALHMSDIIKTSIETLQPELQKSLVKLSVFTNDQFDLEAARKVLDITMSESEGKEAKEILYELRQLHLIECDRKLKASNDTTRDKKIYFSLHPLVHRYLSEWKKPPDLEQAVSDAVRSFADLYEDRINKIVRKLDTNSMKGMELLQKNMTHVMQFYDILHDKYDLLKPYPKETRSKHVLSSKRISDLTDLLLADVKKRRLFQSEADRAKRNGSDAMYAFWMVEHADVLLILHDKPDIALEMLDNLTNGKYAALRGLHSHRFYPPLVHSLFHKVKGLVYWKKRTFTMSLQHLNLSLQFLQMHESSVYSHYTAKVLHYIGKVYMDLNDLEKAEENFKKGFYMILDMDVEEAEHLFSANNQEEFEKKYLQWDIPVYLQCFGEIKLKKALLEKTDKNQREELLDKAQHDLARGLRLDRQLRLDKLDGYCAKKKLMADVYAEKGLFDEALSYAEESMSHRRQIIQCPHFKYVEGVYQLAKLYMLKGNQQQRNGNSEDAMDSWITSYDYFGELKDHHLVNGSIAKDHPLVAEIKSDHLTVTKLANENQNFKKLCKFYKDLSNGCFDSSGTAVVARFKEMLWTPLEKLKNMFAGGGDEFGERDFILQREDEGAQEQMEEMMREGGRRRQDSGMGNSSSDQGDSMSSTGGSISGTLERMRLEKSLSLEDTVFTEATAPPIAKPEKKRQRTIDE